MYHKFKKQGSFALVNFAKGIRFALILGLLIMPFSKGVSMEEQGGLCIVESAYAEHIDPECESAELLASGISDLSVTLKLLLTYERPALCEGLQNLFRRITESPGKDFYSFCDQNPEASIYVGLPGPSCYDRAYSAGVDMEKFLEGVPNPQVYQMAYDYFNNSHLSPEQLLNISDVVARIT